MSYKNSIKTEIGTAMLENPDTDVIDTILEPIYSRALEEAKITGQSIESITYEILEGLEEALCSQNRQIAHALEDAAEKMADIIHRNAKEDIAHHQKLTQIAQERLAERIDTEKAHLHELSEALHRYADEKAHRHLSDKLHSLEAKIKSLITSLTQKESS